MEVALFYEALDLVYKIHGETATIDDIIMIGNPVAMTQPQDR